MLKSNKMLHELSEERNKRALKFKAQENVLSQTVTLFVTYGCSKTCSLVRVPSRSSV